MSQTPEQIADAYLDGVEQRWRNLAVSLLEPIRSEASDLDAHIWAYGGGLVGFGTYHYENRSGNSGDWFALGVGVRKRHVSFFSNAASPDTGNYLLADYADSFSGAMTLKACVNFTREDQVDAETLRQIVHETVAYFGDRLATIT